MTVLIDDIAAWEGPCRAKAPYQCVLTTYYDLPVARIRKSRYSTDVASSIVVLLGDADTSAIEIPDNSLSATTADGEIGELQTDSDNPMTVQSLTALLDRTSRPIRQLEEDLECDPDDFPLF